MTPKQWSFKFSVCCLLTVVLHVGAGALPAFQGPGKSVSYEKLHPDASWCGPRVLFFFGVYLNHERPLDEVVRLCRTDEEGLTSMADLLRAAKEMGLEPTAVKCSADDLAEINGPALISLSNKPDKPVHFVGVLGIEAGKFLVLDPSMGVRTRQVSQQRIASSFTGHAILLGETGAARARWVGTPTMLAMALSWGLIVTAIVRPRWAERMMQRVRGSGTDARQS